MDPNLAKSLQELHDSLMELPKSLNGFTLRCAPHLFRQVVAVFAEPEEVEPLTRWATRALETAWAARPSDDPTDAEDDRIFIARGDTVFFAGTDVSVVDFVSAWQGGRPLPPLPEWLLPFARDVYIGDCHFAVRDGVLMLAHGLVPVSIVLDLLRDGASVSHIRNLLRLLEHVVAKTAGLLPRAERIALFGHKMAVVRHTMRQFRPLSGTTLLLRPNGEANLVGHPDEGALTEELERLDADMTARGEGGWMCLVETHPWNLCAFGSHIGIEPTVELKQARRLFMLRHPKPHEWLDAEIAKCR